MLAARLLGGPLAAARLLDERGARGELLLGEVLEVAGLGILGEQFTEALEAGPPAASAATTGRDFLR